MIRPVTIETLGSFESDVLAAQAGAQASAAADAQRYQWVYARAGKCEENPPSDVNGYSSGVVPMSSRCNAGTVNKAALCWPKTPGGHVKYGMPTCSYKNTTGEECAKGKFEPNAGDLYVCTDMAAAPDAGGGKGSTDDSGGAFNFKLYAIIGGASLIGLLGLALLLKKPKPVKQLTGYRKRRQR